MTIHSFVKVITIVLLSVPGTIVSQVLQTEMDIHGLQRFYGLVQDAGTGVDGNGQFTSNLSFPTRSLITVIDDDTSTPTYVENFHNACNKYGIKGVYACLTNTFKQYPNNPKLLQQYTSEGFQTVIHGYSQESYFRSQESIIFNVTGLTRIPKKYETYTYVNNGVTMNMSLELIDIDKESGTGTVHGLYYWEHKNNPPTSNGILIKTSGTQTDTIYYSSYTFGVFRDIVLAEENLCNGIEDLRENGFANYEYWVTPYGSHDVELQQLAQRTGMKCLVTISTNDNVDKTGTHSRWALPRYGLNRNDNRKSIERIKAAIDEAAITPQWIIIGTHFNTGWTQDDVDTLFKEFVEYAKSKGLTFVTLKEGLAEYETVLNQEQSSAYANLIDGKEETFFHSGYYEVAEVGDHYLQTNLNKAVDKFRFYFKNAIKNNDNYPTTITIKGSNDGIEWNYIKTISNNLPTNESVNDYYSELITSETPYCKIRFYVNNTSIKNLKYFTFSEFYVLPENINVAKTFDAVRAFRANATEETATKFNEVCLWNKGLTEGSPIAGYDHYIYADAKQKDNSYVARYLYKNNKTLATATELIENNENYIWTATLNEDGYYTFKNTGDENKYLGFNVKGSGFILSTTPVILDIKKEYAVHKGSVGVKRVGDDDERKYMATQAQGLSFNRFDQPYNSGYWCTDYVFVPVNAFAGQTIALKSKFYRLQGKESGNYINSSALYDTTNGQMSMTEDGTSPSTIFYLTDDSKLISYNTGTYIYDAKCIGGISAANGQAIEFLYSLGGNTGYYTLYSGSNYICDDIDCVGSHHNYNTDNCEWRVQEVASLPVTIGIVGYSTIYTPVALEIPEGVTAYRAEINGNSIDLYEFDGVIPANQGAILKGNQGVYSFNITENTYEQLQNVLLGTIEKTPTNSIQDPFTLQTEATAEAGVIMRKYTGEYINGFKMYMSIPYSEASSFSIRFPGTTAVEVVKNKVENNVVYDLQGRPVVNPTKGIYILNGKKTLF